ncbi:hydroxypyruvate isomerase family protein [Anatilimnocola sp. NA78]|uniref:hydroxypyruvate isomerase family protein n=1 Tax=Anatilimnocola sp. NA78 TaxID=3415683 RepID=UPI003CE44A3D
MTKQPQTQLSRRQWLGSAALAGAAISAAAGNAIAAEEAKESKGSTKGNVKQSVVYWCFNVAGDKWDIETTAKHAKALGCKSVELCEPELWPTLKKNGLICAIAPNGMPGAPFMKGFNNPKYHDEVIARTTEVIDKCAEFGYPSVIAFTGFKFRTAEDPNSGEISAEEGAENCVKGLKKIIGHAEKKKVTICLEHLNSRDGSHPMKGHPGYQGDDVDYCAKIIRAVGSERMKLLFDIYHVQIMNGDVMRRIEQLKDVIGHVHTAGNPGRGELDDNQEINYPPIMRKLIEVGYQGYVGQEFIPTRDPLAGLKQAVTLCDV